MLPVKWSMLTLGSWCAAISMPIIEGTPTFNRHLSYRTVVRWKSVRQDNCSTDICPSRHLSDGTSVRRTFIEEMSDSYFPYNLILYICYEVVLYIYMLMYIPTYGLYGLIVFQLFVYINCRWCSTVNVLLLSTRIVNLCSLRISVVFHISKIVSINQYLSVVRSRISRCHWLHL